MSNAASSEDEAKTARKDVVVKTEPVDEEEESVENTEIKDYAETTMNELLGWYGYDKVGSHETKGLNLHRFTSAPSPPSASSTSPNPSPSHSNANTRPGRHWDPAAMVVVASDTHEDDSSTTPNSRVVCSWCQKMGMRLFTLRTTSGVKAFCSEICFTQCRRASFKKYKVCDWCKHIRHTVNYVDFQDGEQQLQFCSDKCLNQYKMNIFCRETQAHLQLHPHLQGHDGKSGKGSNATLITPDLWLRDCSSIGMNGARNGESDDDVDDEALPIMPRPLSPVQPSLPERPASRDVSLPLSRHSSKLRVREKRRRHHHHHHLRPHNYYHTRRSGLIPTPERNGNEQPGRNHATVPPPFPPIRPNGPIPTNVFPGVSPRMPRFPPPGPPLPGVPPITVMVPYPIVVPVPVPIPIPIPIPIPLDVQQLYAWRRGAESARRNGNVCNFGSGSAATSRDGASTNSGRSSEIPGATLLSPTESLEVDDDDNDGDCEESDVEVSRKLGKESQKRHRSR